MNNQQQILELCKKGLHLVPWSNRNAEERKPLWKGWAHGDSPSVATIEKALVEWPLADWAIVPKGFAVLDLDVKNGNDGIKVFEKWCSDNKESEKEVTKHCAITRTYSGGLHIYFRYSGKITKTINVGSGVEFKINNASVHVPPSEGYTWIQPFLSVPELPELPSFIEKYLTQKTEEGLKRDYKIIKYSTGERRLMLCSMAGALRNCSLTSVELFEALKAVAKQRCVEEFPDDEIRQIAEDFGNKEIADVFGKAIGGCEISRGIIRFVSGFKESNVIQIPAEPIKVEQEQEVDPDVKKLTHPNQIIGEWVDCVDYNNPMNQPIYGLASAIAGLSTLMGRRYVCNGAYANQYVIMLGATSTGKNAPLSCAKAILRAIKADHLIAASKIASGAGMIAEMGVKNELLWTIDEMAFMLRGLASRNPPPYIIDLNAHMLQTYSGGVFEGVSKADGVSQRIENPYPNILGAAQPTTFQESLNSDFIESGFLGRFMLLRGNDDYKGKLFGTFKGSDKEPIIPDSLVRLLTPFVGTWNSAINNGLGFKKGEVDIPVTSDGAKAVANYFDELADMRTKLDQEGQQSLSAVISKNREKMIKLAMLHALTCNMNKPEIAPADVKWASDVLRVADKTVSISTRKMSTNETHKISNKFIEVMEKVAGKGITKSDLIMRTRWLKSHERNAILDEMLTSGEISAYEERKNLSAGRPVTIYYLTKYGNKEASNA